MPHTYTRNFRVRYYECDAHGHLNNANYLRYMQETAFDASAAVGYDHKRYDEIGHHWLIRETQIEFINPARYNDHVQIRTWIVDFRRASSRRIYEFTNSDTGAAIARAYTDWVYLETETGLPSSIPVSMVEAFYPEGVPDHFPGRNRFTPQPEPPLRIFSMSRQVGWLEIDQLKHVNNAVYLDYVTECGMQVIEAFGWAWERMIEAGFAIYLRRLHVQYIQQAHLGEEIIVDTWAGNVRRTTATRYYRIKRKDSGEILARINTDGVWVNASTFFPVRIPANFLADFAENIV